MFGKRNAILGNFDRDTEAQTSLNPIKEQDRHANVTFNPFLTLFARVFLVSERLSLQARSDSHRLGFSKRPI